jgi:hypothetical protein
MFQFSGFPPPSYVFTCRCWPFRQRVSPFGHQRFFACTRLPAAFRSVPRPSSALDAQASPVRLLWLGLSCGDRARSCSYTICIRVGFVCFLACPILIWTDSPSDISVEQINALSPILLLKFSCNPSSLDCSAVCETNCQTTGRPVVGGRQLLLAVAWEFLLRRNSHLRPSGPD